MFLSDEELVDIVDKALAELTNAQCPHCQGDIRVRGYIDLDDIIRWVNIEVPSKEDGRELALRVILDTLKELGEEFQSLNRELKALTELMERERRRTDEQSERGT